MEKSPFLDAWSLLVSTVLNVLLISLRVNLSKLINSVSVFKASKFPQIYEKDFEMTFTFNSLPDFYEHDFVQHRYVQQRRDME